MYGNANLPIFYGQRVGYYKGLAEGMILERYRRRLPTEGDDGVFEIVRGYVQKLRTYFAYYKDRHRRVTT
jgi:hypothetical protein